MYESQWPPPINAVVRDDNGAEFSVVAHRGDRVLGEFIVIRRTVPGGWQSRPVLYAAWNRGAYTIVRGSPTIDESAASVG